MFSQQLVEMNMRAFVAMISSNLQIEEGGRHSFNLLCLITGSFS